MNAESRSLSEIVGPWQQPKIESGLIERCRAAWGKPLETLTNRELATFLRQKIAVEHMMPIAQQRVAHRVVDDSEIDDGELATAIEYGSYCEKVDRKDRRNRGLDQPTQDGPTSRSSATPGSVTPRAME